MIGDPYRTLDLHIPNLPHCWSRQIDLMRKPQDALAHGQTDGLLAEASAPISGRAAGWGAKRMPSRIWDSSWRPLHFSTANWLLPSNSLRVTFLLFLTSWLIRKEREENVYMKFLFFFPPPLPGPFSPWKFKRIGKTQQRNQRQEGRRKKARSKNRNPVSTVPCYFLLPALAIWLFSFATYWKFWRTANYLDVRSTVIKEHMTIAIAYQHIFSSLLKEQREIIKREASALLLERAEHN